MRALMRKGAHSKYNKTCYIPQAQNSDLKEKEIWGPARAGTDGRRHGAGKPAEGRGYLGFGSGLRGRCLAEMDLMIDPPQRFPSEPAFDERLLLLGGPV